MLTRFEDFSERFDEVRKENFRNTLLLLSNPSSIDSHDQVARLMKKGNFSNFAFDLKCRLVDLEHTQSVLKSKPNPDISLDAMQQAITVTRLMIDTVESYVIQLLNEPLRAESPNSASDYHYSRKSSEGYQSTPGPMTPNSISDLMMMTAKDEKECQQQRQDPASPVGSLQPLAIFTQGHEHASSCLMEPGNDYQVDIHDTRMETGFNAHTYRIYNSPSISRHFILLLILKGSFDPLHNYVRNHIIIHHSNSNSNNHHHHHHQTSHHWVTVISTDDHPTWCLKWSH